ncbi:MAG: ATPase, T2SS/T4P/T4SS family [Candidatus Eremiobacterota bacterium]
MKLDPSVVGLLPRDLCRELKAVAFGRRDQELLVAVADPDVLPELRPFARNWTLTPAVVPLPLVEGLLAQSRWPEEVSGSDVGHEDPGPDSSGTAAPSASSVRAGASIRRGRLPIAIQPGDPRYARPSACGEDAPIVRVVNLMLSQALNDRAWEIALVPGPQSCEVYYRVDGVWHDVMSPPAHVYPPMVARLRQLARLPGREEQGWMEVTHDGRSHRFHVRMLPTPGGELCLLERAQAVTINELGLPDGFRRSLSRPDGLVLVQAPEGHGLRITFGAVMRFLNQRYPVGVSAWSCAWTDVPVAQAQHHQDRLLGRLRRFDPPALVVEEVTDAGDALLEFARERLVVAGVRQVGTLAHDGLLEQRLLREQCGGCRGRGCDRCKMTGCSGWRLVARWSEEPESLSERVWDLAHRGVIGLREAEEAVGAEVVSSPA